MTDTATKAGKILATARDLVTGDRAQQHGDGPRSPDRGDAAETYATVARLWSAYKGVTITAVEVLEMMALLKIGRPGYNPDNAVDAAGYVALAGAIRKEESEK